MSQSIKDKFTIWGDGTTQNTRLLRGLEPNYVKLDDRKLSDLLSYAREYSKLINFYNLKDKPDGNWEGFFVTDISVILATLVSVDLEKIESAHTDLVNGFHFNNEPATKLDFFIQLFHFNLNLANRFDEWYSLIRETNKQELKFETIIETELFGIIKEKVIYPVQKLYGIFKESGKKEALGRPVENVSFDNFHPLWGLDEVPPTNVFNGKSLNEKLHQALLQLRLVYRELHNALSYSVFHFQKYFVKSLEEKSDHKPDIGLFIGFLQLFQYLQRDFNYLTSRYLHYYYKEFLKQTPRENKPDKVHICAELTELAKRYKVEKGTLLTAGVNDQGEDIFYQVSQDTILTQAKIEELKTVYMSRRDDIESTHFRLITDIFAAPTANSSDGLGGIFDKEYTGWPLFGEEQEYKPTNAESMVDAAVGFAVSSPMLFLREGDRKIKVTFNFDPKSTRIFKRLVCDVRDKVNSMAEKGAEKTLDQIFYERIFNQTDSMRSFRVFVTGNRGWVESDPFSVTITASGGGPWDRKEGKPIEDDLEVLNSLTIEFDMPASKPAIVAYNPAVIAEGDYETPYPIAKFIINERKQPYIYSFLQNLVVSSVDVEVDVKGMKQFFLYSDEGQLDNRQPFVPFGILPSVGSSLLVGNSEIFRKDVSQVVFDIEWKDMPATVKEFKDYYEAYNNAELSPENYVIRLSALTGNRFLPDDRADYSTVVPLFHSIAVGDVQEDTPLQTTRIIMQGEPLEKMAISPDPMLTDELEYSLDTQTGFFKIELSAPANAFGHQMYPEVFADVVQHNAKATPDQTLDIPKQPYTPIVKSISCNYRSATSFSVALGDVQEVPERLFHIHPFGLAKTYEGGRSSDASLFPHYDADGYLYLGLSNVNPPEPISFLFQLSSKHSQDAELEDLPEVEWAYMSRNQWKPIKDWQFLYDTTDNFTKSGLIGLQLPRDVSVRNSILSPGLCWLRIKATGNLDTLCKALDVRAQAFQAEWVVDPNDIDKIRHPLPPGSITDFEDQVADIAEITQPFESFNGQSGENDDEFFSRVSERLRHKNRAITHWDYERIVLNEFRNVFQVKCLSALSNPILDEEEESGNAFLNVEKGERPITGLSHEDGIIVVAVPKRSQYIEDFTPKFNYKGLQQMEDFLKARISPFVNARVVNPQYEYVRVIANVMFEPERDNGLTLQLLNNDIRKFLAPWLDDSTKAASIGGSLNENVLKNYIKSLPYVSFVTKFSLLHIIEENGMFKLQDTAEEPDIVSIVQARPWGILLPDDGDHEINIIHRAIEEAPIPRINTESVIRFQNRVNILGSKKYVKIRNTRWRKGGDKDADAKSKKFYTLNINIE